jgi:hypothetical protein
MRRWILFLITLWIIFEVSDPAYAEENTGKDQEQQSVETMPITEEDRKIIENIEMLSMMEILEQMELMQEFDLFMEEKTDEKEN